MVEADKYCIDIIQQVAAMQGALAQAYKQLLDSHLRTCLVNAFSSKIAGGRERMISEIVELFARATRSGPAKRP